MNADKVGSKPDDASVSMTLLHMAAGAYVGQAISVAAKFGIADLLEDGPKSPAALAEAAGAHADSVHRLLRLLASVGVFAEQADGRFASTPLAAGLRTDAPGTLGAFTIMLGEDWHLRAVGDLYHSVRTGEPAFAHVFGTPPGYGSSRHPFAGRALQGGGGWTRRLGWAWARRSAPTTLA